MSTLVVGLKWLIAPALCAVACTAQNYEIGGAIGYGVYRDGSVYAPGGEAKGGIRNRFAAGAVFGEDLFSHISGEIRYLYHDGHPFLSSGGVKSDMQGQSQAVTYDLLFHLRTREQRLRPFFSSGAGAKGYLVVGPAPFPQPLPNIASLLPVDQWKPAASLGGGVKYRLYKNVILRGDFLDYLTAFPKLQIAPAPHGTARGIFEQFTPLFGVGYTF